MRNKHYEKAKDPAELHRYFITRANDGDAEGLADLYEEDAILVIDKIGNTVRGKKAIQEYFEKVLEGKPSFIGGALNPTLINGNLALTSSKLNDGKFTIEVVRLQEQGQNWLWVIDYPSIY